MQLLDDILKVFECSWKEQIAIQSLKPNVEAVD